MKLGRYLLVAAVFILCKVWSQTDAPPELSDSHIPENLPSLEKSEPYTKGKLEIIFRGARSFSDNELQEAIARQVRWIEDYGLDEANAYDAAFFLELFYRQHGFNNIDVTETIVGPWKLLLKVDEGSRTTIGHVEFYGNHAFDAKTLTDYILGATRERYPRMRNDASLPYVASELESGVDLIERFYIAEGYLDVNVSSPVVIFSDHGTVANISVTIDEGTAYRFGMIHIEGEGELPKELLRSTIRQEVGGAYTERRLEAARRKLLDLYRSNGYFRAEIEALGSPMHANNGSVPVVFQIRPGELYRFDGITISGNSNVRNSFILKRMEKLRNKLYSPMLLNRKFRELIETGLFKDLRITPHAIGKNMLRLDVAVKEAKAREFGIGIGYATFEGGIFSLSYRDRNIFHTGRPLHIEAEINQRGYTGEIIYEDPWFLNSDYHFKARLYGLTSRLPGYSRNEFGIIPSFKREFTEHWNISASIRARTVSLYDVKIEPESLVGPKQYSIISLGFSHSLDFRNDPVLPTQGFIFTSSLELAPQEISEISLVRGVVRFSYYLPVTTRSRLAFGVRAGIAYPLDGDLPIQERFFNGGATTVRSFAERTLGPKDKVGYPIGGQAFTVYNVEYKFPIYGDLYGAVFFDAGNLVPHAANIGFEDMRYGIGAGLRYNLPIGAIRLDYGLNPSPAQGEARGAFHFAIGVAF